MEGGHDGDTNPMEEPPFSDPWNTFDILDCEVLNIIRAYSILQIESNVSIYQKRNAAFTYSLKIGILYRKKCHLLNGANRICSTDFC